MNQCKHLKTRVASEENIYRIYCEDCNNSWAESDFPSKDYSFTYERRGHPTQVVSTRTQTLDEAVDNIHYQMERFGLTKDDIRKELLNG
jgi:hypothetical protein